VEKENRRVAKKGRIVISQGLSLESTKMPEGTKHD